MRATSAAGGAAPPVAAAAVAALRGTAPGADCWSCCTFKLCCGHGAVAVCILLFAQPPLWELACCCSSAGSPAACLLIAAGQAASMHASLQVAAAQGAHSAAAS